MEVALPPVLAPNIVPSVVPSVPSVPSSDTNEHELWSFTNALFFIVLLIVLLYTSIFAFNKVGNIQHIKADWANQRCSPMIMPFAGMFGYNAKENFEFCIGSIFNTYSQPYMGSIGTTFSNFTGILQSTFDSISSLRNVIASLGGGINVIFQEFTDRISNFFFQLRLSAIHMKSLFMRMYAILFSVMYMGMSGITGMTSFTNTFLFSFLDTFCFPGNTEIITQKKGRIPIKDVKIGDVLLPGYSIVTATFSFYSRGQPMVKLGPVTVSTNHYLMHNGKVIKAGDHPSAVHIGEWDSDELLYCFNTDNHIIPVEYLSFIDYDETSEGDKETMNWMDGRLNGKPMKEKDYTFTICGFSINEHNKLKTMDGLVSAKDIKIGDKLTTGSSVVGIIRKQINEYSILPNGTEITPSTLFWDATINNWKRIGDDYPTIKGQREFMSFVVVPNSQIELEDGTRVRDYMELCSPDAELYYSKYLEK
jgi:hypothetical protein